MLRGPWSQYDQKDLFCFWISHSQFYSKIYNDPILQNVLENQILQTKLIYRFQEAHKAGDQPFEIDDSVMILRSHSQAILHYIEFIHSFETLKVFLSTQSYINPYGMVLPPKIEDLEKIKIIIFWTRYVDIFLKMNSFGETPSLQIAIGNLVKEDFQKMSEIMNEFILESHQTEFSERSPVLDQYLQFAGDIEGDYKIESALRASKRFRMRSLLN
ncbi:hypothetical protein DFH28DRAFT_988307 [Melampsora americana]|nr:hypothetical protein DFH28DRAFT_988307 [Melampsora americana]